MADCKEHKFHYGGQAVIEGVMMRGPKDFAVAVRRANGDIDTTTEDIESAFVGKVKWLNKPFLRGTFALIDAMELGIKALKYSADLAMKDAGDAEEKAKAESQGLEVASAPAAVADPQEAVSKKSGSVNDMAVSAMMVLGLALGVAIFFFVPILIVKPLTTGMVRWERAAIEGGIKIALFVLYVVGISFLPDIRRVFQYHGAEHKTINAYEAGVELTPENVKNYTKAHVRCGTSFILVVLVTSIIVFMFLSWDSILLRFLYKLLLLPVVAGISYEVIRFAGNHKDWLFSRLLVLPGLAMQRITTREPEPEMIEVAIRSLQCVLAKEEAECEAAEAS